VDKELAGMHHITAMAGEPQGKIGHPGTFLTFLPWPKAPRGRKGSGQVTTVSFGLPKDAIRYGLARLDQLRIVHGGLSERFGEQVLSFSDPDGFWIEPIETANIGPERAYADGPIFQAQLEVLG
jgi:glyoxalase family protein